MNRGQEKDVSRETAVAVVAFIDPCAVQGIVLPEERAGTRRKALQPLSTGCQGCGVS